MQKNVLELQSNREGPGEPARALPWVNGTSQAGGAGWDGGSGAPSKSPVRLNAVWFGVAFFGTAWVGHFLSITGISAMSLWLPAGLYVATLLLHKTRDWPAFVAAGFVANLAFSLLHGRAIVPALLIDCSNSLEAVAGAWLVRRFVSARPTLASRREFIGLTFCAAVISPLLGTALGATTVSLMGMSPSFLSAWRLWWASEAMAVLLVAPFILAWFSPRRPGRGFPESEQPRRLIEAGLLVMGMTGFTWYMLAFDQGILAPYKSRLLLFVLWAGLRFGARGATAANLLLALLMTFFTAHYRQVLSAAQIESGD